MGFSVARSTICIPDCSLWGMFSWHICIAGDVGSTPVPGVKKEIVKDRKIFQMFHRVVRLICLLSLSGVQFKLDNHDDSRMMLTAILADAHTVLC